MKQSSQCLYPINFLRNPLSTYIHMHTQNIARMRSHYTGLSFSRQVVFHSLQRHGQQHARLPCPTGLSQVLFSQ